MASTCWTTRAAFVLLVALALPPGRAAADLIVFDFEDQPPTYTPPGPRPGALPSLSLTQSGLTLTITRTGSNFDIVANVAPGQVKPPSWGLRSLDPFVDNTPAAGPFVVNFSAPVFGFTADGGDYGDDADTVTVRAFSGLDGTGDLLATSSGSLPGGPMVFDFVTLTASSSQPIRSVVLIGGQNPGFNSVFFDNFRVETSAIPEPASALLLGLGALGLGAYARRRRAAGGV